MEGARAFSLYMPKAPGRRRQSVCGTRLGTVAMALTNACYPAVAIMAAVASGVLALMDPNVGKEFFF